MVTLLQAINYYFKFEGASVTDIYKLIVDVERKLQWLVLQNDGAVAFCNDKSLGEIALILESLMDSNIRYLSEMNPWLRVGLDSYLGDSLALGRGLLLRVMEHSDFRSRCDLLNVSPDNLRLSPSGVLLAKMLGEDRWLNIFDSGEIPSSLLSLLNGATSIARSIGLDIRSDGKLRLSEVLGFFNISYNPENVEWGTDHYMNDVLSQVQSKRVMGACDEYSSDDNVGAEGAMHTKSDLLQTYQSMIDLLWRIYGQPTAVRFRFLRQPIVGAGLEMNERWLEGQSLLFELVEAPEIWVLMRGSRLTVSGLSVLRNSISSSVVGKNEQRFLLSGNAVMDKSLKHKVKQLYDLSELFGQLVVSESVSLALALSFYGVKYPKETSPAMEGEIFSDAQLLSAVNELRGKCQLLLAPSAPYFDELLDLEKMRSELIFSSDVDRYYHPVPDSRLGRIITAYLKNLQMFLSCGVVRECCKEIDIRLNTFVFLGTGEVLFSEELKDSGAVLMIWKNDSVLQQLIVELCDVAKSLKDGIGSDGKVSVAGALHYYGLSAPGQSRIQSVELVEEALGKLRCGFKSGVIAADELIDEAAEVVIQKTVEDFLNSEGVEVSLFEFLGSQVLGREQLTWSSTERWIYFVSKMLWLPQSMRLLRQLLISLGWYGGSDREIASPLVNASLLRRAVLLNIGPPSNAMQRNVLGYYLNKEANWGRSYYEVKEDFSTYFRSLGTVSVVASDMACIFVLHHLAPELLVNDVSTDLLYGPSLASTKFVMGVNISEAFEPGLSRKKTIK